MAITLYEYGIDTDTEKGLVNVSLLRKEIERNLSITIALHNIVSGYNGDINNLAIFFKDELPLGQDSILTDLLLVHDGTKFEEEIKPVMVKRDIGVSLSPYDGVNLSVSNNSFGFVNYTVTEEMSIKSIILSWENFQVGDYGWISVINPVVGVTNQEELSSGNTEVNVGSTLINGIPRYEYFKLENGAVAIEFWNGNNLLEVRKIVGFNEENNKIIISPGVSQTISTSIDLLLKITNVGFIRGVLGIDGGVRLIGNGTMQLNQEFSASQLIPAGIIISIRVKTVNVVLSPVRNLAVNFSLVTNN